MSDALIQVRGLTRDYSLTKKREGVTGGLIDLVRPRREILRAVNDVSFDIPAGGATLDFYTFFEIEGNWDYGYVEVHDLDTGEWYTLDAPGTVDYIAHPQDNPNTPSGREPADYEDAGRWHAFTGSVDDWTAVSMDLSPFAEHEIDLYFTTWQDGAFTLQMMYVDDISIPEIGFIPAPGIAAPMGVDAVVTGALQRQSITQSLIEKTKIRQATCNM